MLLAYLAWALWPAAGADAPRPAGDSEAGPAGASGGPRADGDGPIPTRLPQAPDGGSPTPAWPAMAGAPSGAPAGPSRLLAGWVVDADGEPVTDALVTAAVKDAPPLTVLSDESGGFRFAAAPVGEVRIAADGAELGAAALMVGAGGDVTALQLTLEASAWVVVLVDASIPREGGDEAVRVELHADDASMNTPVALSEVAEAPDDDDEAAASRTRVPAASGAPGDRLRAVAGVNHEVLLRGVDPPFGIHRCGQVRADRGAEVVVVCTLETHTAVLRGRLVSAAGGAIPGLEVGYEPWCLESMIAEDSSWTRTTSGPDGRFELHVPVRATEIGALETTTTGRWSRLARRNVPVIAGATTDLGDLMVMAVSEVPVGWMNEPFGGVGGLVTLSDRGISLIDVEPDCPLAAAGVEGGDIITHIEGLDAGTMHMSEALKRLRGDVGTTIAVRVRNPMGETWELELVRGVIRPGRENWPDLDRGGEKEHVEIEFEPLEIGGAPSP